MTINTKYDVGDEVLIKYKDTKLIVKICDVNWSSKYGEYYHIYSKIDGVSNQAYYPREILGKVSCYDTINADGIKIILTI